MPVISRASIQNLKLRVDIVDVVSSHVALKRAGSKFKGLSPFNQEKTASFFVSPEKGLFKCFSSGKAGDVISFVMETERLNFTEAVEALAKRYNIPLEYEKGGFSQEERSLRQELLDLHEEAAEVYREAFLARDTGGDFIRDYWTQTRKFDLETAEDFKIGFASPDGGQLTARLRKRGYSDEAVQQCGLFFLRSHSQPLARFRGRLMIPIRDHQGRIVAFTARQLSVTPQDDPAHEAKYVNSPETPVFTKGQILFNLDRARRNVGGTAQFLMVEGQLDGDAAGQAAALRLLPLALAQGLEMTFLPLPEKTDPDDLIREGGAEALARLRAKKQTAMQFAVAAVAPDAGTLSAQQMSDACRQLFEIISQAPSEVARAEYLAEVSALLGLNRSSVDTDYRTFRTETRRRRDIGTARARADSTPDDDAPSAGDEATQQPIGPSVEQDLLLVILHFEGLGKPLAQAINHEWIDTSERPGRLLDQFLNDFEHDAWPGSEHLEEHLDDPADRNFIASLAFERPDIDMPERVANDGIRQMVSNFCVPKIRKIELEIAAKQRKFDADLISLLKTNDELRRLKLHPPSIRHTV